MGSKIGRISIKYDGAPYEINIDYYDRTIAEILDQVFKDYSLNKELLKFYSLAFNS